MLPTHTTRARMTVVYAPAAGKVCFRERPPFRVTFTTIASMNIGSLHWNAGSPIPSRAGVTLVILIHVHYYSNSERSRVLRQQRFIIYTQ